MEQQDTILTQLLANYRDKNRSLIERFKNFKHLWSNFKKNEYFEEKDITKRGFFTDHQLKSIKDAINHKKPRVDEVLDELLKALQAEKHELDKIFEKNQHSQLTITAEFETLMKNYTHKQYDLIQTFNELVPGIFEQFENMIGQREIKITQSQQKFIKLYTEIEKALIDRYNNKGIIYNALYKLLSQLQHFQGNKTELTTRESQLEGVSQNSIQFFSNYFRLGSAKQKFKDLNNEFEKVGLNTQDKTYNQLDKEKQEQLDKYIKTLLEELFNNITLKINNQDKKATDLIKEIIKLPSNLKELKNEYKDLYKKLEEKIRQNHSLERKKSLEDFYIINVDGIEEKTTFKLFEKDILKKEEKKDIIEKVNNYLEELVESKKDKNPYKNFITANQLNIKNYKEHTPDEQDTIFQGGDKFKSDASEIKHFITEAIETLVGPEGIGGIYVILENAKEGEDLDIGTIKLFKDHIVQQLKTIGLNLAIYKDKEKISWTTDTYKLHLDTIKNLIKQWEGNISNKEYLRQICNNTKNQIENIL
ncbi:MAG: hypothetical protein ACOC16_00435 [Nanoarchaeota archaeon]